MTTPKGEPSADAGPAAERLRRPEPRRTAPIRHTARYFRGARAWDSDGELGPSPGAAPAQATSAGSAPAEPSEADSPSCDDPVARGVALGYEVIEEHIRQGRDAARGRNGAAGDGAEPKDLADFLRRAQHLYQDAGSLVQDFIEHVAHSPTLEAALNLRSPPAAGAGGAAQAPMAIGVALTTAQPAQAWIELHAGAGPFTPALDALRQAGAEVPPISDLSFTAQPGAAGLLLHIGIPAGQAPGVYSGVILDAASGLPRGTACVRIGD